jgi:hypothetical protein
LDAFSMNAIAAFCCSALNWMSLSNWSAASENGRPEPRNESSSDFCEFSTSDQDWLACCAAAFDCSQSCLASSICAFSIMRFLLGRLMGRTTST